MDPMEVLFQNIDNYCERLTTLFWAEPLNALTNILFIIFGFIILKSINFKKDKTWTFILSINAIIVGVGSFLFHTFANVLTKYADIIPIVIFMTLFFYFTFRKVFNHSNLKSICLVVIFMLSGNLFKWLDYPMFNGSHGYFHCLLALFMISFILMKERPLIAKDYFIGGILFFISLIFRSIDHTLCSSFPVGTHFLWHIFVSTLVFRLLIISRNFENGIYQK